jgi:hypothetical protein
MADHYFNTLEYARQLEAAGVPDAQAEVHANALAQVLEKCLSTAGAAADLKNELSFKISELDVTLRAEISELEVTLRAEISELGVTLRAEISKLGVTLRAEISEAERRLRVEINEAVTGLTCRIDKLEATIQERFRWQWWANGVMVAMLIGLYFR